MTDTRKWQIGCGVVLLAAIAAVFGVFAWALRDIGPPPILGDVHCDNHDCESQDTAFEATLEKRFPAGSSAKSMVQILSEQGFTRDNPSSAQKCSSEGEATPNGVAVVPCPAWDKHWNPDNRLSYSWGEIPCGNNVGVMWSADNQQRIKHLEAYAYYACL